MWTEEKVLHFINLYEKKTMLWKAKHPHHFNKLMKNDAWNEISQEIGFDVETCKKKMTSLMSACRREKMKMKKSCGTGKGK